ncbi:MAG: winged helix-turn-helix transcriptional regulator [Clostridiaceae bacterium]
MNNHMANNAKFPSDNIYEIQCPIVYALDILGQKWKIPILYYLIKNEPTRYNELKRGITGVTNMMLTKSLKELEEHKLITRTQYETIPPKVEYSVTERGKTLLPTLNQLYLWGEEQIKLDYSNVKESISSL